VTTGDRHHLAGGQSRRMGVDKAFVLFDGQTLIERTMDAAAGVR
jgi:molybdopterin-guanine dinucleotide biosynthesis protein A